MFLSRLARRYYFWYWLGDKVAAKTLASISKYRQLTLLTTKATLAATSIYGGDNWSFNMYKVQQMLAKRGKYLRLLAIWHCRSISRPQDRW